MLRVNILFPWGFTRFITLFYFIIHQRYLRKPPLQLSIKNINLGQNYHTSVNFHRKISRNRESIFKIYFIMLTQISLGECVSISVFNKASQMSKTQMGFSKTCIGRFDNDKYVWEDEKTYGRVKNFIFYMSSKIQGFLGVIVYRTFLTMTNMYGKMKKHMEGLKTSFFIC